METLKELKSIIAGAPEGATHIASSVGQSRYLKHNVRRDFVYYDGRTFCSFPSRSGYLRVCESIRELSDIEQIIELMEQLNKIEPVKEECTHPSTTASYTHVTCDSCHMIRTDGGWGCASRKWFDNIESAKFYEKNGFLPK